MILNSNPDYNPNERFPPHSSPLADIDSFIHSSLPYHNLSVFLLLIIMIIVVEKIKCIIMNIDRHSMVNASLV